MLLKSKYILISIVLVRRTIEIIVLNIIINETVIIMVPKISQETDYVSISCSAEREI